MLIELNEASPVPLYAQIASAVRREIGAGRFTAGSKLPSSRDVAEALSVNIHTVQRAYAQLRDEGLVHLRQGRGAVVVDGNPGHLARLRDLAAGLVAEARAQGVAFNDLVALLKEAP